MSKDKAYTYESLWNQENKIVWNINNLCNFKCEYCFFPYYDEEGPDVAKYSHQEIRDAFDQTGKQWHLYISGGEPFLYPKFPELVELLKEKHPIQISTNLFNKKVKEFLEKVTPENIIMINASLHIGYHNDKSLRKFIKNYHEFKDKGFTIMVSYVTYPPLFDQIESDFEFLRKEGVEHIHPLTYQGVYKGKTYPGSYTVDELKTIRKLTLEPLEMLLTTDNMRFKGRKCVAGKNYFFMDVKGDLFTCNSIRNHMGNMFDGSFVPSESPIKCSVDKCNDSCFGITSLVEHPTEPKIEEKRSIIDKLLFRNSS